MKSREGLIKGKRLQKLITDLPTMSPDMLPDMAIERRFSLYSEKVRSVVSYALSHPGGWDVEEWDYDSSIARFTFKYAGVTHLDDELDRFLLVAARMDCQPLQIESEIKRLKPLAEYYRYACNCMRRGVTGVSP